MEIGKAVTDEQRQPYISPDQVLDLYRRIKFVKGGLEGSEATSHVMPKPFKLPTHWADPKGALIGMRGAHYQALLEHLQNDLGNNPLITKKFKELMMLAKLTYPDALDEVHKNDAKARAEHDGAEARRIARMGNIEKRKREAEKNFQIVSDSIEARFRKMIRSLIAMARKEPDLQTMDEHDLSIVSFLASRKLAVLSRDKLEEIAPSLLEMEKPFIEEFMEELAVYMASEMRDVAVHQLRGGLI